MLEQTLYLTTEQMEIYDKVLSNDSTVFFELTAEQQATVVRLLSGLNNKWFAVYNYYYYAFTSDRSAESKDILAMLLDQCNNGLKPDRPQNYSDMLTQAIDQEAGWVDESGDDADELSSESVAERNVRLAALDDSEERKSGKYLSYDDLSDDEKMALFLGFHSSQERIRELSREIVWWPFFGTFKKLVISASIRHGEHSSAADAADAMSACLAEFLKQYGRYNILHQSKAKPSTVAFYQLKAAVRGVYFDSSAFSLDSTILQNSRYVQKAKEALGDLACDSDIQYYIKKNFKVSLSSKLIHTAAAYLNTSSNVFSINQSISDDEDDGSMDEILEVTDNQSGRNPIDIIMEDEREHEIDNYLKRSLSGIGLEIMELLRRFFEAFSDYKLTNGRSLDELKSANINYYKLYIGKRRKFVLSETIRVMMKRYPGISKSTIMEHINNCGEVLDHIVGGHAEDFLNIGTQYRDEMIESEPDDLFSNFVACTSNLDVPTVGGVEMDAEAIKKFIFEEESDDLDF